MAGSTIHVQIIGAAEARAMLSRLRDGSEALGRVAVVVGSPVAYARYVHEGTRRMRGRPFLLHALRAVEPHIRPALIDAVQRSPGAVLSALLRLGQMVERGARQQAPVRTGHLRRSIHTVAVRR